MIQHCQPLIFSFLCLPLYLQVGVVPALINFNLQDNALVHSVKVADCKAIICGVEMQEGERGMLSVHMFFKLSLCFCLVLFVVLCTAFFIIF